MDKKRTKTSNFSLELGNNTGNLPSKTDIEQTVAKAVGKEESAPAKKETAATKKNRRIPLTTAITPENRANLEAAAHAGKGAVADLINEALEYYFKNVSPIENTDVRDVFLKLYQPK